MAINVNEGGFLQRGVAARESQCGKYARHYASSDQHVYAGEIVAYDAGTARLNRNGTALELGEDIPRVFEMPEAEDFG